MNSRATWSTFEFHPGQSELHSETLTQKNERKRKHEKERKKKKREGQEEASNRMQRSACVN